MILGRRLFGEASAVATAQATSPATFNKYPPLKVRPFGVSGNAMLGFGTAFFILSASICQQTGWFLPRGTGLFWGTKKLKIDLHEH